MQLRSAGVKPRGQAAAARAAPAESARSNDARHWINGGERAFGNLVFLSRMRQADGTGNVAG